MKTYAILNEHGDYEFMEIAGNVETDGTVEINGVEYEVIDASDPFGIFE
jgi:hypothetical protein